MQWWRVITQWAAEAEPAGEGRDDAHLLGTPEGASEALGPSWASQCNTVFAKLQESPGKDHYGG